jgi:hypothetical protein
MVPAIFLPACSLISEGGKMMREETWARKLQGTGYVTAGTGFVIAAASINFLSVEWLQNSGKKFALLRGNDNAFQENPCGTSIELPQNFFTEMKVASGLLTGGAALFSFFQGQKRAERQATFMRVNVELDGNVSEPEANERSRNNNECRNVTVTAVCATMPVLSYLLFILATFSYKATKGYIGECRSLQTAIQELPDNCPTLVDLDCPSSPDNLPSNAFSILSDLIDANCKDLNALYKKANQQRLHDSVTSEQMLNAMSIITPIMLVISACYFYIKYVKNNTIETRVDIENANEEKSAAGDYSSNRTSLSKLFCCFLRKNRNDHSLPANNSAVEIIGRRMTNNNGA